MRRKYSALAAMNLAMIAQAARAQTDVTAFHIGNSLTYHATGGDNLASKAAARGINLTYGSHILCGSGLQGIYENPTNTCIAPDSYGYWNQALPNYHWDYVTLEPYGDTFAGAEYASQQMIALTRSRPDNLNTKFYDYQNFCQGLDGEDYKHHWVQAYDGTRQYTWTRDYSNRLMADLVAQHPELSTPIELMPTGEVMFRLDQLAESGQLPGIPNIEALYVDAFHLGAWGNFAMSSTMFAVMFHQDPTGLPRPANMTAATGDVITHTIWDVVNSPAPALSVWMPANGNWSDPSAWSGSGIPDAPGVSAYVITPGTHTLTLDTVRTVGVIQFDNSGTAVVTGTGSLHIAAPVGGAGGITALSGDLTISVPVIPMTDTTLGVAPDTTMELASLGETTSTIIKGNKGTLRVPNIRAGSLEIRSGIVQIPPNGLASGVVRVDNLYINRFESDNSGKLDLTNNHLITKTEVGTWGGSGYTGVTGMIAQAHSVGNWNRYGLTTSMTQALSETYTTLGIARADEVFQIAGTETALWAGQTVTADDTLVMYTYTGDANLDGKLNIDDYTRIDQGIRSHARGWSNGDFDYNGVINIDDYFVLDRNLPIQNGVFLGVYGNEGNGVAAVPEPASVSAMGLGAAVMLGRRTRRRRR